MGELLPCPFCGDAPEVDSNPFCDPKRHGHQISCSRDFHKWGKDGCIRPYVDAPTLEEATAKWNHRTTPSPATTEAEGPRDIKRLVDRFLGWKLPENFNPDAGISFKKTFNDHLPVPMKHEPTGTNLFDASQAEAMLRYVLELDTFASPPAAQEQQPVAWRCPFCNEAVATCSLQRDHIQGCHDFPAVTREPMLYIIVRRGRIIPNHYLHRKSAGEAASKLGGEVIPLFASPIPALGWVMVPRERTPEMGNACIAAIDYWTAFPRGNPTGTGPTTLADAIWEAMLSVAPKVTE